MFQSEAKPLTRFSKRLGELKQEFGGTKELYGCSGISHRISIDGAAM